MSAVDAIDDTRHSTSGARTVVYAAADPRRARLVAEKRGHYAWNLAALEFFLPITVLGVLIFAGPRRKWAALGGDARSRVGKV